jgi:diacylglycerol kinase (ATP)
VKTTVIALVIANSGNIGFTNVSFVPNISVDDGKLDIIVFKKATIHAVTEWVGSQISQTKPNSMIKHWRAKEVTLTTSPRPSIICDDEEIKEENMNIKIVPHSLQVITPNI